MLSAKFVIRPIGANVDIVVTYFRIRKSKYVKSIAHDPTHATTGLR